MNYAQKSGAGHTSRKTFASSTMIVSGLWLLVFLIVHVRAFRFGPGLEYKTAEGIADFYRLEMENLSNPLMVGLLRAQHARRRLAPVARRLERLPVARPDHPAGRRGSSWSARFSRSASPAASSSSPSGRTSSGGRCAYEARRERFPPGHVADKWERHKFEMKLVNPANKRKYTIIVVGTGLAGASAAASLGELGYNVLNFCIQDSPRRAHSIAAQGGINAAKNYQNDGDSIYRLFYDTVKGGDYRSREANVYRLAQLSVNIIDQCVAQGVPFAREYGGLLDNRSFGGAQVSRTFYARGQTGQQLLLGAYQSLMRQVDAEERQAVPAPRDARPRRHRRQGARHHRAATSSPAQIERYAGDAVMLATGGYGNGLLPVDQRRELERHRGLARAQARRALRQSLLHADPPDLHSGQRRPPVEAHADEREPAQRRPRLGAEEEGRQRGRRSRFPRTSATTTSNASTRASATSCRATSRRATPSRRATTGAASATAGWPSISISRTPSSALGARGDQGEVRQPVPDVPRRSRTRIRTRCRCGSTPPSTTRWAGSGWTTT